MIYKNVIEKIKTILENVDEVNQIYSYPLDEKERINKYPAVIFLPDDVDNNFSDTGSNHRILSFKLWAIVNTGGTSKEEVFEDILPSLVDAIIEAFDKGWDFSTIGGHRTWARINSAIWGMSLESKGLEAWAEMRLIIRLDTNIN